MTAAEKYSPRYTVSDYLTWKGDWELWGGLPVAMTPSPFGKHQAVLTRLARILGNEIERVQCRAEVLVELDWIVSGDTVVRPDLVIVCGEAPAGHLQTTPVVAAEILSDSSQLRDSVHKRDLYLEQGVNYYIMADPERQSVEVYRQDGHGSWQSEPVLPILKLHICDHCCLDLSTEMLFK